MYILPARGAAIRLPNVCAATLHNRQIGLKRFFKKEDHKCVASNRQTAEHTSVQLSKWRVIVIADVRHLDVIGLWTIHQKIAALLTREPAQTGD